MPTKKPSLLDEIQTENRVRKGPLCTVKLILADLPSEDVDGLNQAMADPEVKTTAIRRALVARGFQIGDTSIARHRKGECFCGHSG